MLMTSSKPAPVIPATLYHYTCHTHGEPGIRQSEKLVPFRQPLLGRALIWLTDMDTPNAWALGLTNYTLCCDRTQVRVTVHPLEHREACGLHPWWTYRRTVHPVLRDALEQTGMPMHWWVTEKSVPVVAVTSTARVWAEIQKAKTA
jgi:hypothetical protein